MQFPATVCAYTKICMHAPCLVVTLPGSLHACSCKELASMHVCFNTTIVSAIASSIGVILALIELLVLAILLLGYCSQCVDNNALT